MSEVRASYTDSFSHSFDAKGRVTVPSEWREEPFEKSLFIFPSREKCLRVYPASWLGRLQDDVAKLKSADPTRKGVEDLAMTAHRLKLRQAMLKEDPNLVPIFSEIDKHLSEAKAKGTAPAH